MSTVMSLLDYMRHAVLIHVPGTQAHRIHWAFSHRVLFAVNGHVQVCRITANWLDEQQERLEFYWCPADNADQLEPRVLAYLQASGKSLADGQFIICPKNLARLARWE